MLYREFRILSLTALIIIYNDDKYRKSISERTKKMDSVIKESRVINNRLKLI
jgi:uncharacterized membrane protein YqjE